MQIPSTGLTPRHSRIGSTRPWATSSAMQSAHRALSREHHPVGVRDLAGLVRDPDLDAALGDVLDRLGHRAEIAHAVIHHDHGFRFHRTSRNGLSSESGPSCRGTSFPGGVPSRIRSSNVANCHRPGLPGRLEGMPSRLGGVEGRRNPMSFHNTPLVDGTVPPMRSSRATAIRSARPNALNTVSAT